MERLMGVINLDKNNDFLEELTYFRCGAAVPFAGRYRIIDFTMTDMVNSGINDIAVFVRKKYRSLLDHLGEGKQWNLDRKKGGLFILPPDWNDPDDISTGDLRHFHNNMSFFKRGLADYVLHTGSQHICNINYKKVLEEHIDSKADITLIYKRVEQLLPEHKKCRRLDIADGGNVTGIHNEEENKNIYMEMFIINKELLLDLVKECIAHHKSDFFQDGIMSKVDALNIQAYSYQGYHAVINSIQSYYKHSMELLDIDKYTSLFNQEGNFIYTKVKDEVPTKYTAEADVVNSLIGNGCIIEGTVKNSILFRGVHVKEGAKVENSIIMRKGIIGQKAILKNVILDKFVKIDQEQTLIGSDEKPFVVAKRQSV